MKTRLYLTQGPLPITSLLKKTLKASLAGRVSAPAMHHVTEKRKDAVVQVGPTFGRSFCEMLPSWSTSFTTVAVRGKMDLETGGGGRRGTAGKRGKEEGRRGDEGEGEGGDKSRGFKMLLRC